MAKLSKRVKAYKEKVVPGKIYEVKEAFKLLKDCSKTKFDETVEVAINLGIDPKKSDQAVRGSTVLPRGTGKSVKVAVFAQGEQAKEATATGAEYVGMNDLADRIQQGLMDFDVVIATPDAMPIIGKLGKVLGPRGLMPNPKSGTVTKDVKQAVLNAKAGQVRYKVDKNGIIHCGIGKVSFDETALMENLGALVNDLSKMKPSSSKGIYMRKVSLSTTMGPGLIVDLGTLAG